MHILNKKAILFGMNTVNFLVSLLESGVADGAFPSAVAVVGARNQVLGMAAAGDADLDTRYDMASMSKILGPTMVALRALEDGEITLDDTVGRFFDAPADKAHITIRHLMTHTGGFTPFFWLFEETDDPNDAAGCILRHPLEAMPDGTPRYSCMGYILLGKILEKRLGAPLDVLAQERVFKPLGMVSTCYNPIGDNIAPTEVDPVSGIAWRGTVHDENARFLRGISANAGVFSDIHDTARYAAMLATGGGNYLSPATMKRAITNYTPGHDTHRGLGFHLAGLPGSFFGDFMPDASFGHTGFTGTSLVVDPTTGFYAALLTNRVHPSRDNDKHLRFRRRFHNMMYTTFCKGLLP